MHVDWFVFFAQIVNFLILVFLLKHFLYGRIIKAMDNREARIVARYDEAEALRKEAEKSAALFDEKNRTLAEKQEELLNQAVQDAETRRKELLEKSRQDVDVIRERWQETVEREKESFLQDLRQRAGKQIYAIARRILNDMADTDMEERIVRVFLKRISTLDDAEREILKTSIAQADAGIIVQSTFPIGEALRKMIEESLRLYADRIPEIRYETTTEIVSGIELRAHGHKLAWSLGDYLETLEEGFAHALMEEARIKA
ncbi:MAG: F-type H+-transporting ATPase subunit b [Syntrophus sp. SKADARSKE-3]|nr:F-type H+-transporting ATPase subunit b [Syntrophus sp. SKADARSKE-3]